MEPAVVSAIASVDKIARQSNTRFALIGALVLELRLSRVLNEPAPRGTLDADFIVAVNGWTDFDNLLNALIKVGFKPTRFEHRLARDETLVDILPVGKGIAPDGKLTWPKSQHVMNVLGCEEALGTATNVEIESGLSIPVVTMPALVVLKMMAFNDRAEGRQKWRSDAQDIFYCLDKYEDIRKSERRYSLFDKFSDVDINHAGAILLGLDISDMSLGDHVRVELKRFLEEADSEFSDCVSAMCDRLVGDQAEKKRTESYGYMRALKQGYLYRARRV